MSEFITNISADETGIFIERPNRFLGHVDIKGSIEKVHIKDPGRLRELLYPGNRVLVANASKPGRKTAWDLVAAEFQDRWIVVNSGFHRQIAYQIINGGNVVSQDAIKSIRPEVKRGRSRIDYCIELNSGFQLWIEVKGCTLAEDGVALFPDAPTERGTRHLMELISIKKDSMRAGVLILIFREDAKIFSPNSKTDIKFYEKFYEALDAGVEIYPFTLSFDGKIISLKGLIPISPKKVFNKF